MEYVYMIKLYVFREIGKILNTDNFLYMHKLNIFIYREIILYRWIPNYYFTITKLTIFNFFLKKNF